MTAPTVYRLRARNTAIASENKIHDDAVARQFGFAGGLVPGVDVFAYLAHVPAEAWGREWLERGSMTARFDHPVYDGHAVEVRAEPAERADARRALALSLHDDSGVECASGVATLPADEVPLPDLGERGNVGPLPSPVPASADVLRAAGVLAASPRTFRADRAVEYLDAIGERLALFREAGLAHPGWLLRRANRLLSENFRLGPWIHVASDTLHGAAVPDGARISTRGRVTAVYERKGHEFVELDVLVAVDGRVPAMHVRHTAIYRPRRSG
jgi:hypothetical protein